MKSFSGILKTVFLLCGSVIGAGFIGGTELAVFFGESGYIPFLIFSAFAFFAGFSIILLREKERDGLIVSKTERSFTRKVFLVTEFVFCSAMLAGINDIFRHIGAGIFSYIFLFAVFFASCLTVEKNVVRADKLNSVFMPAMLLILNVFIIIRLSGGDGVVSYAEQTSSTVFRGMTALLYVFLNIFVSAPAACKKAKENDAVSLVAASAIVSVIVAAEAFLILRVCEKFGTLREALPLLSAAEGGGAAACFCVYVSLFVAAYTSFYTCLCSLKSEAEALNIGNADKRAIYGLVYCFSLAGLKKIVTFVYPIFGAAGACYVINSLIRLIVAKRKTTITAKSVKTRGIKNKRKAHNSIKLSFGGVSKWLKKEKIR